MGHRNVEPCYENIFNIKTSMKVQYRVEVGYVASKTAMEVLSILGALDCCPGPYF